jgi:hypothetical protein
VTRERLDAIRIVLSHGGWLPPDLGAELLAGYEAEAARAHALANLVQVESAARETLEEQIRRHLLAPNIARARRAQNPDGRA